MPEAKASPKPGEFWSHPRFGKVKVNRPYSARETLVETNSGREVVKTKDLKPYAGTDSKAHP